MTDDEHKIPRIFVVLLAVTVVAAGVAGYVVEHQDDDALTKLAEMTGAINTGQRTLEER